MSSRIVRSSFPFCVSLTSASYFLHLPLALLVYILYRIVDSSPFCCYLTPLLPSIPPFRSRFIQDSEPVTEELSSYSSRFHSGCEVPFEYPESLYQAIALPRAGLSLSTSPPPSCEVTIRPDLIFLDHSDHSTV